MDSIVRVDWTPYVLVLKSTPPPASDSGLAGASERGPRAFRVRQQTTHLSRHSARARGRGGAACSDHGGARGVRAVVRRAWGPSLGSGGAFRRASEVGLGQPWMAAMRRATIAPGRSSTTSGCRAAAGTRRDGRASHRVDGIARPPQTRTRSPGGVGRPLLCPPRQGGPASQRPHLRARGCRCRCCQRRRRAPSVPASRVPTDRRAAGRRARAGSRSG
mmetsp:Transcript_27033/g.61085  ORF Transcript_27033/g.61085 Transcript_27033/m.61085 type:complete len:218 (-) Transcript_27033:38-691(-)